MYILIKRFYLTILQYFFKFDNWHSKVYLENSKYMYEVAKICNNQNFDTSIELGCGLGELLSVLNTKNKIGVDIDSNVIKAAYFLRHNKIDFFCIDILDQNAYNNKLNIALNQVSTKNNLLIMINWIHSIEFTTISRMISFFEDKIKIQYLLVDLIIDKTGKYKYNHSIDDFINLGYTVIENKFSEDQIRKILLLRKIKY